MSDDSIVNSHYKIKRAAKYIDSGEYDKFEKMDFKDIDESIFNNFLPNHFILPIDEDRLPYIIMNEVKTLEGAKYLDKKGLIPADYFSNKKLETIFFASTEQLEFYVAKGANINSAINTLDYGFHFDERLSVLDRMVFGFPDDNCSLAHINKMIELGAKRGCQKNGNAVHTLMREFMMARDWDIFLPKLRLLNEKGMLKDEEKIVIALSLPQKYKSMKQEFAVSEKDKVDFLQLKTDLLREKIDYKMGKTDQYSDKTTKIHINEAKGVMKFKNSKRGEAEK